MVGGSLATTAGCGPSMSSECDDECRFRARLFLEQAVEGSGGGWKTMDSGCATMVCDPAVYMQYLGKLVCLAK